MYSHNMSIHCVQSMRQEQEHENTGTQISFQRCVYVCVWVWKLITFGIHIFVRLPHTHTHTRAYAVDTHTYTHTWLDECVCHCPENERKEWWEQTIYGLWSTCMINYIMNYARWTKLNLLCSLKCIFLLRCLFTIFPRIHHFNLILCIQKCLSASASAAAVSTILLYHFLWDTSKGPKTHCLYNRICLESLGSHRITDKFRCMCACDDWNVFAIQTKPTIFVCVLCEWKLKFLFVGLWLMINIKSGNFMCRTWKKKRWIRRERTRNDIRRENESESKRVRFFE